MVHGCWAREHVQFCCIHWGNHRCRALVNHWKWLVTKYTLDLGSCPVSTSIPLLVLVVEPLSKSFLICVHYETSKAPNFEMLVPVNHNIINIDSSNNMYAFIFTYRFKRHQSSKCKRLIECIPYWPGLFFIRQHYESRCCEFRRPGRWSRVTVFNVWMSHVTVFKEWLSKSNR